MGSETVAQAASAIDKLCNRSYSSATTLLESLELMRSRHPALSNGVETALLDLQARIQKQPLRQLLTPRPTQHTVRINQFAGSSARPESPPHGCQLVKLKLTGGNPALEAERIQRYCARLPAMAQLRLDANQCWSLDEARLFLDQIDGLPIEAVEEPLRNPDLEHWARLQQYTSIPLALDESLTRLNHQEVLAAPMVRRLVLKTMLLGGPRQTLQLARQAAANGKQVIITSSLESAYGIWANAQLAAAVDAETGQHQYHGLATSNWLRKNLGRPPTICGERLELNEGAGLGIPP